VPAHRSLWALICGTELERPVPIPRERRRMTREVAPTKMYRV
jgi:hypothetical protein